MGKDLMERGRVETKKLNITGIMECWIESHFHHSNIPLFLFHILKHFVIFSHIMQEMIFLDTKVYYLLVDYTESLPAHFYCCKDSLMENSKNRIVQSGCLMKV